MSIMIITSHFTMMRDYLMIIEMSKLEKITEIESIFIEYPNLKRVRNKLHEVLAISNICADPECALLTGDSGSGKTAFIKQFVYTYPVIDGDEININTIIYVEIPSQSSIKDLCIVILKAFGDPLDNTKLTTSTLKEKVIKFCNLSKTKLIIFDEFQHPTERSSSYKLDNLADWIKNLINTTRIPVLIVGMPESKNLLSANRQLNRRFYTKFELQFFTLNRESEIDHYFNFLSNLSNKLIFKNNNILLYRFYAISLYCVAYKNLALFMRVIRFACRVAIMKSENELQFEHFLAALYELKHIENVNNFIPIFRSNNFELVKTHLVNEKVNWEYIDAKFSDTTYTQGK